MTVVETGVAPKFMKRSQAKIWIRTGLLVIFGILFGITLIRDMMVGVIAWEILLVIFIVCLPVGFSMRKLVPMQVHRASRAVTLSFDKTYFILIWLLVIAKAIFSYVVHLAIPADLLMTVILGLMAGRLSGICLRVRNLKIQNGFVSGID